MHQQGHGNDEINRQVFRHITASPRLAAARAQRLSDLFAAKAAADRRYPEPITNSRVSIERRCYSRHAASLPSETT
jgi:hypothetical protein